MSHLFSRTIINDAIKEINISDLEDKIVILKEWYSMYQSDALQKKSEKEFEGVYSEKLFGNILGYTGAGSSEYTREKEPKNISNGQKPDIGLGYYSDGKSVTKAIVELKDAATSLDRPQQRAGNLTPVQQAFKYKPLYNCRWVIVSNFYELRLYTDTYQDYESFTLAQLIDPKDDYKNFRKFYAIFHADVLISKTGESKTEKLLAKVRIEEEVISKKFYQEYKELRTELMRDIWARNRQTRNMVVIENAQRIIDRIVFICFCEDRGLLPQNKLKENILRAKEIDMTPWETLKIFFRSIDKGSVKLGIPDGYNGGLFASDMTIDDLVIGDEIIEKFVNLGRYDFSEDGGELSVEILGHIFEQSISDIEELRSKIEAGELNEEKTENKISKRKKDGIFYTPAYIVDYIVRNSLGKYLEEHEEKLKEQYGLNADITKKDYRKREIQAYTEYQKILHNVKVLDPACGSGAFLVRVFDFLMEENKRVANILSEGDQVNLFHSEAYFKEILQNNIYGVDLNEESIEITKLSLWLKTAQKGKKLATLDKNIKCGNSLIDDPVVAGDKAFDWNQEFPEIMASGGFDVIVGNPPYVNSRQLGIEDKAFFGTKYFTAQKQYDLYTLFIEKALSLLNEGNYLGFIIPNKFLATDYGFSIRKYIAEHSVFENYLDISNEPVFIDASVYPIVMVLRKTKDILQQHNEKCDLLSMFGFTEENPIISKLKKVGEKLGNICEILEAIHTGNIREKLIKTSKEHENCFQLLRGQDVNRYECIWDGLWIDYSISPDKSQGEYAGLKAKSVFENPKILLREIALRPACTYDDTGFFTLNKNYVLFLRNERKDQFSLKYITAILNSSAMGYFANIEFANAHIQGGYLQFKKIYTSQLPIPNIPLSEQKPFIEKADKMLVLNKELHEKSEAFLKNISTKYHIEKVSRKLEKWYELDFESLIKELKVKISFEGQEELMGYFEKRASEVREIVAKIQATDREIDEMVFELYGLTEEEREVVLGV